VTRPRWLLAFPVLGLLALAGPVEGGDPLSPSKARFVGPADAFGRADDCASCHPDEVEAWSGSAHAHASLDNPWYLASFRSIRASQGPEASRHCGGCHDPLLLASGALDGDVGPEHPLASEGVSCLVCHGIVETGPAGNGDYTVDLTDLPEPWASVDAHAERMMPAPLRDGTLCRGCHRGFLTEATGNPTVVPGFDDWGAWEASGYAGVSAARIDPPGTVKTCVDCHVQRGHGMPGGRTHLAAQTGRLGDVTDMLSKSVRMWVPVVRVDGARVDPGSPLPEGAAVELDVVVRNVGAGHHFPGGVGDTQDVWLRVWAGDQRIDASEDSVHFRTLPLDADGVPERAHRVERFATAAFDRRIPPGEASVVRVRFTAPGGPIDIGAELVHVPHRPELQRAACAVTTPDTLDGCAESIQTVLARATPAPPDAAALYAHALGWSRGLQEEVGEALASLEGRTDPAAEVLRARVYGRQGRFDDALAAADRAGLDHPAVHRARGRAAAQVWKWAAAVDAFARVVALDADDPQSWADLARAHLSRGESKPALEAADRGLTLNPRHPDLLRSRAFALRALEAPDADEAIEAWLAHRPLDHAPDLRGSCDQTDAECAERVPIPILEL
jgi:Flp pilus assembly protein TadD